MRYFNFNTIDSRDHGYVLSIKRSVLPAIDPVQVKIPRRAGVYIPIKENREVAENIISVRFGLLGNSNADLRAKVRTVADWLFSANNGGDPQPLWLSDEPSRIYYVHVSSDFDLEEAAAIGEFTINFIAPDPFARNSADKTILFDTTTGIAKLINDGTAPTFPIYRIVPTASAGIVDFRVDWTGGGMVYINRAFAAWETFIIDTKAGTAYIESSGESLMPYVSIESRFKSAPAGQEITATMNKTGEVSARMTFTERYR